MTEVEVVCPAQAASCHCKHPPGHDGPHECVDEDKCNGSWTGMTDEDDDFMPVRFPGL